MKLGSCVNAQGSESTLIFSALSGSDVHRFSCNVCILPTLLLFTWTRDSSQFTSTQTCFPVVYRFLSWESSENHQDLLYVLSYLQIASCNFTALSLSHRRLVRARPWNSRFVWQAVYRFLEVPTYMILTWAAFHVHWHQRLSALLSI